MIQNLRRGESPFVSEHCSKRIRSFHHRKKCVLEVLTAYSAFDSKSIDLVVDRRVREELLTRPDQKLVSGQCHMFMHRGVDLAGPQRQIRCRTFLRYGKHGIRRPVSLWTACYPRRGKARCSVAPLYICSARYIDHRRARLRLPQRNCCIAAAIMRLREAEPNLPPQFVEVSDWPDQRRFRTTFVVRSYPIAGAQVWFWGIAKLELLDVP